MKKLQVTLLLVISVISFSFSQVLPINNQDKMYKAWKQSKLYVVQTSDAEINKRLEAAVKATFTNYEACVTEAEADKLMGNPNNFFVTVYFPGLYKIKQNIWDKYSAGIGIFQGNEKKLQKIDFYVDCLIRYTYLPIAPNMNLALVIPAAREAYTKTGLDKGFTPEANIATMIPSTIIGFKQTLDALDQLVVEKKVVDVYKAVAKTLRADASILKDKTLLVLNNEIMEPFYTAYAFKKELIEVNDLSKLETKDKKYCFLIYGIEEGTSMRQVTVIDCATGKIIFQDSGRTATTGDKMKKLYADRMNDAVKGKILE